MRGEKIFCTAIVPNVQKFQSWSPQQLFSYTKGMRRLHRQHQKKSREIQLFCHPMRSKAGEKTLTIFSHIPAMMLKPTALITDSSRGRCPIHSLLFTLKHEPSTVQDESASTHLSLVHVPLFSSSYSDHHTQRLPAMALQAFISAGSVQRMIQLIQLDHSSPTPGHSVGIAAFRQALDLCQCHQPLVSLWPVKLNQKDLHPEEFTDHLKKLKTKQCVQATVQQCCEKWYFPFQ